MLVPARTNETTMKITSATGGLLGVILYSFEKWRLGLPGWQGGRQGLSTFSSSGPFGHANDRGTVLN
jgi:hypothetical protein